MYSTSLPRDELIKSALDAIQDLDFIFKRSTDNPFEKQTKHLLPVVSRPLTHIREVAMALDNLFMRHFNRSEHFGHSTSHPNTATPFPNFFTPPSNMFNPNYNPNTPNMHMAPPYTGIYNTFAPYTHMPEELQHRATKHLKAINHPDSVSRLSPFGMSAIEKAAKNIDFMKGNKNILRSALFYAVEKDFIKGNTLNDSFRLHALRRLINNFVFLNGNDEENFMLFKSLVLKD